MKQRALIQLVILFTAPLLLSGSLPHGSTSLQRELADLAKRGFTYRWLNDDLIELTDPVSGMKQIRCLREPSKTDIQIWADTHGVPIIEIDPSTIDTTLFAGWYKYWTEISVSGDFGNPVLIGDLNGNQRAEAYGQHYDSASVVSSRIYEVDSAGNSYLMHEYNSLPIYPFQSCDVDRDGLTEVMFFHGDSVYSYEQPSPDVLPTNRSFAHALWEYPGTAIETRHKIGNLDNDLLSDFVYRGSENDSSRPSGFRYGTYVAEYDSVINNFRRVWSTELWENDGESLIGGYDVGDYDGDGLNEFSASGIYGQVWIVENCGDNQYQLIWQDSLPFLNQFYQVSGDVDGDGNPELFIGASMANGNWITVFETDSNNHYSPRVIIHLLSGQALNVSYQVADMNNDSKVDLVVLIGSHFYVLRSTANDSYSPHYFRYEDARGIALYDFNKDEKLDLAFSKSLAVSPTQVEYYTEIYLADKTNSVNRQSKQIVGEWFYLEQNYPNPFNSSTTIRFSLAHPNAVRVSIVDLRGRSIRSFVFPHLDAGPHQITWDAFDAATGIYFCIVDVGGFKAVRKMLLLK